MATLKILTKGFCDFTVTYLCSQTIEMDLWAENAIEDISDYELAVMYNDEMQEITIGDFIDQKEIESYLIDEVNELYLEQ